RAQFMQGRLAIDTRREVFGDPDVGRKRVAVIEKHAVVHSVAVKNGRPVVSVSVKVRDKEFERAQSAQLARRNVLQLAHRNQVRHRVPELPRAGLAAGKVRMTPQDREGHGAAEVAGAGYLERGHLEYAPLGGGVIEWLLDEDRDLAIRDVAAWSALRAGL